MDTFTTTELKAWRTRADKTQEQAAQFLGVTARTYQRMESGATGIKAIYARVITEDLAKRDAIARRA